MLFPISCVVCLGVLVICIAGPLVFLWVGDTRRAENSKRSGTAVLHQAQVLFLDPMQKGHYVMDALRGYVVGTMEHLPPQQGTSAERLEGQVFDRFTVIASYLLTYPNISVFVQWMALAPSGIVAFVHPPDQLRDIWLMDQLAPGCYGCSFHPTPWETIELGRAVVVASFFLDNEWMIQMRSPIYMQREDSVNNLSNFWGFAAVGINVLAALKHVEMAELLFKAGMKFTLYVHNDQKNCDQVLLSSLPPETSAEEFESFISHAPTVGELFPHTNLFVAMDLEVSHQYFTGSSISVIIAAGVFAALLFFGIASVIILHCTQEYDARPYAPKKAPFAVLTIGLRWGDGLWEAASEELTLVASRFERVLDAAMRAHHAYPMAQLQLYTSSYTTRSVDAAARMAFAVIKELQRHPIDGLLRKRLHAEPPMALHCAIHWCRDATVMISPATKSFRYEGPDVMDAGRMWLYSAPNTVTLSSLARAHTMYSSGDVSIIPYHPMGLPNDSESDSSLMKLFTIADPDSAELRGTPRTTKVASLTEGAPTKRSSFSRVAGGAIMSSEDSQTAGTLMEGEADGALSVEDDGIARALRHPVIPTAVASRLRAAFRRQAGSLSVSFESARVFIFFAYSSFVLLFRRLSAPERNNIFQRLIVGFGVPLDDILEHIAARCTVNYIQECEEAEAIKYNWQIQQHCASTAHESGSQSGSSCRTGETPI